MPALSTRVSTCLQTLLLAALPMAAAFAQTQAAAAAAGSYFSHHDWELACDSTRTCRAAGYTADRDRGEAPEGNGGVSVLLIRSAGPAQPVSARVRFADWYDEPLPQPPVRLHIDARDSGVLPPADGNDPAETTLTDAQVAALLPALMRDSTIVFTDSRGRQWPLSDAGAAAVLLRMDEVQGRPGTRGALARRGTGDESGVLPALPLQRVQRRPVPALRADDARLETLPAVRRALLAALSPGQDCLGLPPGEDEQPLQVVGRLDDSRVLIRTPCWSGAYNSGDGYWVMQDTAPYQAVQVTSDATDYADGVLNGANKGRGLGDCYWHGEWVWDGQAFVQTLEATTGLCRGISGGGPWSLPTRVAEVID